MNKRIRDSNIELLRIVLMIMIIMHQLIVHGCKLSLLSSNELPPLHNIPVFLFVNAFLILAVNTYVFISAYYGIRFSLKTLISFIIQASFYSVIMYLIGCFSGLYVWRFPDFYRSLIPILSAKWWFLSGYILLFILSPILNAGLSNLTKKQHLFIMLALVLFCASYYITNFSPNSLQINNTTIGLFVTIYVIGRYLKQYPINIKKPFLGYLFSSLVIFLCSFFYYKHKSYDSSWDVVGYTNPFIILASVCFFFTFKNIRVNSVFINKVSVLTFGIYLLHDADPSRKLLISLIQQIQIFDTGVLLFIIFVVSIIIFVICACIEKMRQIIFTPFIDIIMRTNLIKRINF